MALLLLGQPGQVSRGEALLAEARRSRSYRRDPGLLPQVSRPSQH